MYKACFYFLMLAIVFGCKKSNSTIPTSQSTVSIPTDTLFLKQPRLQLLSLENSVANSLNNVTEFTQIQGKIDTINTKVNLATNVDLLSDLNQEIIDLEDLIPSNLSKNEILTRTSLLRTYVLLLESTLKNSAARDSLKVEQQIQKLLEAYNSLTFQLNETKNTITKEFQEELTKKSMKRDTLLTEDVAPLF